MVHEAADREWAEWSRYFDDVEHAMLTLFHARWMWHTIRGILDSSGVEQYTVVQNYFIRTYTATVCTAIRREADDNPRTTSLKRCLRLLIKSRSSVTRERFTDLYCAASGSDHAELDAHEAFRVFAPHGGDTVESATVNASLQRLDNAAKNVKKYTDEVLAHRQYLEPVTVTFDEINHAFDELGEITKQYYRLRHPGEMLFRLTPVVGYEFLNMFMDPWFARGSTLAHEADLG